MDEPHEHHEPPLAPKVVKHAPRQRGQRSTDRRVHQHGLSTKPATKFATSHGPEHGDHEDDTALRGVEFFLAPSQLLEEEQWENGNENERKGNHEADRNAELS